jgi:flagellar basal-body rod protein FlgC
MSLLNVFGVSSSALTAQSQRLSATASNIANADSISGKDGKAYRAKQVYFQPVQMGSDANANQGVQVSNILESDAPPRLEYDPNSPFANEKGFVEKSNVNTITEMTNMISAQRSYEQNVDVMQKAQQMLIKSLEIGK